MILILIACGLFIGNALTIVLYLIQSKFNFIKLESDVYFMDYLPIELTVLNYIQNSFIIFLLVSFVSIYPLYVINRLSPANLRKYELN